MRRSLLIILLVMASSGCSVINFSANYYTPPEHYQHEIVQLWEEVQAKIPLKYAYQIAMIDAKASDRLNGVPAISEQTVLLPEDFVKYVYQNYYNDRAKIFRSVIVHEICHREFDLPSKPPEKHFEVDARAIALLGGDVDTAQNYYRSLYVMKSYWFARKGVAGHAFNVGWNAVNLISSALGGPGVLVDWYATDLEERMGLIVKHYKIPSRRPFRRSRTPEGG